MDPETTLPGPEAEADGTPDAAQNTDTERESVTDDPGEEATEDTEATADEDSEPLSEKAQRALNKRIGKEVARRKKLEKEIEALKSERDELQSRTDDEDRETVLTAAQSAGVLSSVMSSSDAKGYAKLRQVESWIEAYEDALDAAEDGEATINGKEYDVSAVKKQLRAFRRDRAELERRFGSVATKAQEKALEVWKLGLAAKKAGWKPGRASSESDEETPDTKTAKRAPVKTAPGGGTAKARTQNAAPAPGEVKSVAGLAAFISAGKQQKD